MALDKEYFDAINIDVVKKKYYNANKVNAVFADIRSQAEALQAENLRLREELAELNSKRDSIGAAVLSAQQIYREIVDKANVRAAEIVAEAEQEREELRRESLRQQEYAVLRVENCFSSLREQYQSAIDALNTEWQDFLCGLYPPEDDMADKAALPEDLNEKLAAIASGLREMEN
ncbi:MAG: hypothetical protein J6J62_06810 [Oscillospiraceae bacterium]|nr:hypothetical protein [Oscillospiraceae bacterium]